MVYSKDKLYETASYGSALIIHSPLSSPPTPPFFVLNIFHAYNLLLFGPCLDGKGIFTVWEPLFEGKLLYFNANYNRSKNQTSLQLFRAPA